jgi:hypothetical protein
MRRSRNEYRAFVKYHEGKKEHLEDLGVDEMIKYELILKK